MYYFVSEWKQLSPDNFINMSNDDASDANDNLADDEDFSLNNISKAVMRQREKLKIVGFLLFAVLTLVIAW